MRGARRRLCALGVALLLTTVGVAAPAAARDIQLSWVPGVGAPSAGYVVYSTTVSGVYQHGVDVGPRSPDASGIVSYSLKNAPDDETVYVRLTAYSEGGMESPPSNEVGFPPEGFPPPGPGEVVIEVSEGSANPLLDASEGRLMDLAGLGVVYAASMDPRGRITGSGVADVSGDGAFETAFGLRGRIRGRDSALSSKLVLRVKTRIGADPTNLRGILRRRVDSWYGNDDEDVRLRGKWSGVAVNGEEAFAEAIDPSELGWRVSFRIDEGAEGTRKPVEGALFYGRGKSLALAGAAIYREAEGAWSVRLRSSGVDRGVVVKLADLVLDDVSIESGRMVYKAFGQRGRMELPQPF